MHNGTNDYFGHYIMQSAQTTPLRYILDDEYIEQNELETFLGYG